MADRDQATVRREIAARRRAQAFQMRREGASFEAIGSRLGITRQAAHKMIAREVRYLAMEAEVEERRLVHAEALMDIWRALYPLASEGDLAAVDRFLRVEERLARLLGLDRQADGGPDERGVQIVVGQGDAGGEGEPPRTRRFRRSEEEPGDVPVEDPLVEVHDLR
jgi:hypothetical protein